MLILFMPNLTLKNTVNFGFTVGKMVGIKIQQSENLSTHIQKSMAQTPTNKFSLWFNCQPDGANHKYWAVSEIPIDEIFKLYDFAVDEKNKVSGYGGKDCIKVRANMMPAKSGSGNQYMKMVISDYQPKQQDEDEF